MAIEFVSDRDAPEGFIPKPRGGTGRLAPTAGDIQRMSQPRKVPKVYTLKNPPPLALRGRVAIEPTAAWNAIPQAEALAGIEAIMARAEKSRLDRVRRDLNEAPRQRLMRELVEIQEARAAKVVPEPEVETDERKEQTRPKAEGPSGRVRVAAKGTPAAGR